MSDRLVLRQSQRRSGATSCSTPLPTDLVWARRVRRADPRASGRAFVCRGRVLPQEVPVGEGCPDQRLVPRSARDAASPGSHALTAGVRHSVERWRPDAWPAGRWAWAHPSVRGTGSRHPWTAHPSEDPSVPQEAAPLVDDLAHRSVHPAVWLYRGLAVEREPSWWSRTRLRWRVLPRVV